MPLPRLHFSHANLKFLQGSEREGIKTTMEYTDVVCGGFKKYFGRDGKYCIEPTPCLVCFLIFKAGYILFYINASVGFQSWTGCP